MYANWTLKEYQSLPQTWCHVDSSYISKFFEWRDAFCRVVIELDEDVSIPRPGILQRWLLFQGATFEEKFTPFPGQIVVDEASSSFKFKPVFEDSGFCAIVGKFNQNVPWFPIGIMSTNSVVPINITELVDFNAEFFFKKARRTFTDRFSNARQPDWISSPILFKVVDTTFKTVHFDLQVVYLIVLLFKKIFEVQTCGNVLCLEESNENIHRNWFRLVYGTYYVIKWVGGRGARFLPFSLNLLVAWPRSACFLASSSRWHVQYEI